MDHSSSAPLSASVSIDRSALNGARRVSEKTLLPGLSTRIGSSFGFYLYPRDFNSPFFFFFFFHPNRRSIKVSSNVRPRSIDSFSKRTVIAVRFSEYFAAVIPAKKENGPWSREKGSREFLIGRVRVSPPTSRPARRIKPRLNLHGSLPPKARLVKLIIEKRRRIPLDIVFG